MGGGERDRGEERERREVEREGWGGVERREIEGTIEKRNERGGRVKGMTEGS